ncbi:peptidoglycan-binding domain-containing protein [Bifidobacterium animalis]|nr:peptidoglycan-binding domain-containing protein [Bifidobacterium animalis]
MHRQRSWPRAFGMTLLAMLLVGLLVVGVVATTVGIQASREQPEEPVTLTTTIRTRTLADEVTGRLVAFPKATVHVPAEGTVTREALTAGANLDEGGVIGVVDERPILLMQGAVPMWRTLAPGSKGEDVRQLQAALARLGYVIYDDAGAFGDSTALAVNQYLAALGYESVDATNASLQSEDWKRTAIPHQQLVFSPSAPVMATSRCGIAGQKVAGELCVLETAEREHAIAFPTVDVSDADLNALEGASVTIPTANGPITGTVGKQYVATKQVNTPTVGEGQTSQGNTGANDSAGIGDDNRIYLRLENADTEKLQAESAKINSAETPVTVTRMQGKADALTVESSALQQDGSQIWVMTDGGRRVNVDTGLCVQGICEIDGDGLADGMAIVLPEVSTNATAERKRQ